MFIIKLTAGAMIIPIVVAVTIVIAAVIKGNINLTKELQLSVYYYYY